MKSILVAVDGSGHADKAADLAIDMAVKNQARLTILHVLDEHRLSPEETHLAEVEYADEIRKYAGASPVDAVRGFGELGMQPLLLQHAETDSIIRKALGEGLVANYERQAEAEGVGDVHARLANGDPATEILAAAKKCDADIIVVGSRGQNDIRSLLLGSVSHKVTNLSEVTVITVK